MKPLHLQEWLNSGVDEALKLAKVGGCIMNLSPSSKKNPCLVCGDFKGDCLQAENQHYWQCWSFPNIDEEWQEYEIINGFRFIGNTKDDLRGRFCLDQTGKYITPYHNTETNPCPICSSEQAGGEV